MNPFNPITWSSTESFQTFVSFVSEQIQNPATTPRLSSFITGNFTDMKAWLSEYTPPSGKPTDQDLNNHTLTFLFGKYYFLAGFSRMTNFDINWLKPTKTENKFSDIDCVTQICYNIFIYLPGQSIRFFPEVLGSLLLLKGDVFLETLYSIKIEFPGVGPFLPFSDTYLNPETKQYLTNLSKNKLQSFHVYNAVASITLCQPSLYASVIEDVFSELYVDQSVITYINALTVSYSFILKNIPENIEYKCPVIDDKTGCNLFSRYFYSFQALMDYIRDKKAINLNTVVDVDKFLQNSEFSRIFQELVYRDIIEQKSSDYDYIIGGLFGKRIAHTFYDGNMLVPNTAVGRKNLFEVFWDSISDPNYPSFFGLIKSNYRSDADWNQFHLLFSAVMRKSFWSYFHIKSDDDLISWFSTNTNRGNLYRLNLLFESLFSEQNFFTLDNMRNLFYQCETSANLCTLIKFDCRQFSPNNCYPNEPRCNDKCPSVPIIPDKKPSTMYSEYPQRTGVLWFIVFVLIGVVAVLLHSPFG